MPRAFGQGEVEPRREPVRDRPALAVQRSEGSRGAAELQLQRRAGGTPDPLPRPHQRRQPGDELDADADHLGRLQQRARQQRRRRVPVGQRRERIDQARQVDVDQGDGATRGQDHRRVEHVLARAAPVDEGRRRRVVGGDATAQLAHERNRQASRRAGLGDDGLDVVQAGAAGGADRRGRTGRDHALGHFGIGERRLEIEHRLDQRGIAEDLGHGGAGEDAFEERGHGGATGIGSAASRRAQAPGLGPAPPAPALPCG